MTLISVSIPAAVWFITPAVPRGERIREDTVCGAEDDPEMLEWESDDSSAILLRPAGDDPPFHWETGYAETLRLSYNNTCWSLGEVVEPGEWTAPQPSNVRAGPAHVESDSPMDCTGQIVLEEDNPCPDGWGRPP